MPDEPDIRNKPACDRADATAIVERLRGAGHVAYFTGGCVRDLLLGLAPKDWDVATDAPPKRVRALFPNTQAVGAAFGVILVRQGRSVVEVATFRTDGKYQDGRRPSEVTFTTAEEDAKRRDFTINGLFLDPMEEDRIIDHVGGRADVAARVLRAIGDPSERFAEDHLRLLRAVRFAARFDLAIDPATAAAISAHAGRLVAISPERIADELRATLTPPTRPRAWELLGRFGMFPVFFRFYRGRTDAPPGPGTPAIFERIGSGEHISFGLALAAGALAHLWPTPGLADVSDLLARPAVHRIADALRKSLKISNDETEALQGILEGAGLLLQPEEFPRVALLKRFLARPTAAASRELLRTLAGVDLHWERIGQLEAALSDLERTDYAPPPLVTGDDLTAAGLTPGPAFKRALDEAYDAQLEGAVETKEEALALATRITREGARNPR